jgi:four helix bundle protein
VVSSEEPVRERAFRFGCAVLTLVVRTPQSPVVRSVIHQLVRAATSVGANLEEAKAASTKREFVRFVEIALREARETHYWLRIVLAIDIIPEAELNPVLGEADQLIRILTTIVLNSKRNAQL